MKMKHEMIGGAETEGLARTSNHYILEAVCLNKYQNVTTLDSKNITCLRVFPSSRAFSMCVRVCQPDSIVQLTGALFVLLKQLVSSASTLAG